MNDHIWLVGWLVLAPMLPLFQYFVVLITYVLYKWQREISDNSSSSINNNTDILCGCSQRCDNTFYNDRTSNVPRVVIYIKIFKFPNKIKNKKSYTAQTVLRSISQNTERGKIDAPNAQIHNRPLPWLGTSNSIINEGLN